MRLGVQVSIAGKIYKSVDRASALGCETMQIFSRNPRGWEASQLKPADVEEFKRRRAEKKISPLIVHIPYLANLASPKHGLYQKSIKAYIEDLRRADILGADNFVSHLGSHMGWGEDFGIRRFLDALNIVIEEYAPKALILLENTAGSGSWLGYKFEHLGRIVDGMKEKKKIGICLDTCHAYAAGYDLATEEGLRNTLDEIDSLIGLDRLRLIHINDSKAPLGSRVDRHEHIGKGKIGLKGFDLIVHHPKLRELPFILETPKIGSRYDRMNLKVVRKIYEGLSVW